MKSSSKHKHELFLGCAIAAAMSAGSGQAIAQENNDESARIGVERIVVTARRREESLQDVPVSVSAFSENRIDELQADDLSGLQYTVPNFYFDEGDASNAVVYLRGIGQNDSLAFADPGVGIYVDDVFIARSQAAFLELFDVERVEVLRGPQGTLYGRNTIGGAVKFISRAPTDETEVHLEAGVGDYNFRTLGGRVSGALVAGTLRGKAAISYIARDGYNTNLFDGRDNGDQNSLSARFGLYYTPRDDLDLVLTTDLRHERPDTARSPTLVTNAGGFGDPLVLGSFQTFSPITQDFTVNTNASNKSDTDATGTTLRATWRANDSWTWESITSYRTFDFEVQLDTDATPLPLLDVFVTQDQAQFSQELRFNYDAGGDLSLVGGLYYFNDEDESFSGVDNHGASLFGFPVTAFGLATSSMAVTDQTTRSYAAFLDGTYRIDDRWSTSLGVRYTIEEKESSRVFENFLDPNIFVVRDTTPFLQGVGTRGTTIANEADFDAFTPKFSLSYQANDDMLLYGSAARGFKSGGFDGRANTPGQFVPFEPEFVTSYEAGIKSTMVDGRLVVNAAYFFNDYTDLQVTSFAADPNTGTFVTQFTNAAAATIQGLEVEIFATPTDQLSLNASLGLMDASYDEFNILVGGAVTDVSERPLVNTPEVTASLGATYTMPVTANWNATFHADANYRSEIATEISASPELTQDAYWLTNAYASIGKADGSWEIRAGARNLGDEAIQVQGFNLSEFPGLQSAFFAAPRTYDLRVVFRY